MRRSSADVALLALAVAAFLAMLLGHLGHPLFWSDEADTAMFGTRVREYGYPKVHAPGAAGGAGNVVYQFGPDIALGVKERFDAYIGTTWGHFYFAVPGLWWAEAVADPFEKTARVRLPFALAGALGLGLWLAAVLPAVGPERRLRFAALFFGLSAVSISLLLHLREARYYALLVLLGGAIARVHLRRSVYGTLSARRHAVEQTLLLFLLFQVFYSAYFAFASLLALERAHAARRRCAPWGDLAPFAASALLVAPCIAFFETFHVAAAFARGLDVGPATWAGNAVEILRHLLRHEMLAPALACRAAVARVGCGSPTGRRVAARLLGFGAGYLALGCLNPLPLERYFVVLSPLLLCVFLLDAFALVEGLPARWPALPRRRAAAGVAAAIAGLVALARLPSLPELRGRIAEIRTPYRGPLDFAVPYLLAAFPHPEQLVVATNYEEQAFMYYLGARTIVGTSLNNLLADRELAPDVVVPRRRWPKSLRELAPYLRRGEWREVRLPVRDTHWNNVPALSRSRFVPDPHRFETPATDDPEAQLVLYLRAESSKRTGTSSSP
jgi:hypothetical protein